MSSTVDQLNSAELKADKPVIESSTEQTASENTNQTVDTVNSNNDTNSKKISPLKRDASEISGGLDDQTPAKSKKSRIDRFKEESEALLRSMGLEGGDSEKRLTRSRTRGTPATTPVTKPEPKKVTTGAKRGRKPASERLAAEEAKPASTPVAKKGRGRARKQEENANTTEDEPMEETVENDVEKKSNNVESSKPIEVPSVVDEPEVVESKPSTETPAAKEEVVPVEKPSSTIVEKKAEIITTVNEPENKSATTKTEAVSESVVIKNSKTNESESKATIVAETVESKSANNNSQAAVENNVTSLNNQVSEQPIVTKTIIEPVVESTKPVEEKVVSNDTKLSEPEVQTA